MADINWGLFSPGINALEVLQTYGAAQADALRRREYERDQAARREVEGRITAGDIPGAQQVLLRQGNYQGAASVGNVGDDMRGAAGRTALGNALGGRPAVAPVATAVAAQPSAVPVQQGDGAVSQPVGVDGDIVVNAPAPQISAEEQVAQLSAIDPAYAKQFLEMRKSLGELGDDDKKRVKAQHEAFGPLVPALQALPLEQRRAALDAQRDYLKSVGYTDAAIDAQDLSDAGLETERRLALGLETALKMDMDASQFAARQAQDESQFQRSQATTQRGQNMADRRAREGNVIAAGGIGKQAMKTETDLRKEFEALPDVKAFRDVRSAFNQVKALSKRNDGQSDNALIYSYMKMLDPGSVVREGEFALAGRAAGIPERITNVLQRADNGQSLTARMRQEIASAAAQVYQQRRNTYNTTADQFQGYAKDYGVDPKRVARKYVPQGQASAPAGFKVLGIKRGQ